MYNSMHRSAICEVLFRWIYYCHSSESTGKKTGKTHLCALIKMHYRVRYLLDFDLKVRSGQVCLIVRKPKRNCTTYILFSIIFVKEQFLGVAFPSIFKKPVLRHNKSSYN